MARQTRLFMLLLLGALISCTGTKPVPEARPAPEIHGVSRLWEKRITGLITDLNIAKDGSAILVASAPNRELEGGSRQYLVTLFDANGRLLWQFRPEAPVKAQALADDGSLAVISTYDDRITAYDRAGKALWAADGTCKPVVSSSRRKVICYHDDDAEADVAFDVLDWNGKKISSMPIKDDILALKLSDDGRHLALALTGGQLILTDANFRSAWKKKVSGEILDLDVSSGSEPVVAALFGTLDKAAKQKVAVFDFKGRHRHDFAPAGYSDQIEFGAEGRPIFLHGVSPQGQYLGMFEGDSMKYEERWSKVEPYHPDSPSSMLVGPGIAILASEGRKLMGIDGEGRTRFMLPAPVREESAYLYVNSYAPDTELLAVGTDDGVIGLYQLLSGTSDSADRQRRIQAIRR